MKALLLFCLIGAIIFSSTALAQGPPEKKGWGFRGGRGMMMEPGPHPMMDWVNRLSLTEEQMAKIQELRASYLKDTLVWRNERVVKRFDLQDLLRNPQADSNTILAKQKEISELDSKIQERALLYQLEIRKVLNPEQIRLLPPHWGGMGGPPMMPGRGRGMGRDY